MSLQNKVIFVTFLKNWVYSCDMIETLKLFTCKSWTKKKKNLQQRRRPGKVWDGTRLHLGQLLCDVCQAFLTLNKCDSIRDRDLETHFHFPFSKVCFTFVFSTSTRNTAALEVIYLFYHGFLVFENVQYSRSSKFLG